jgi:hypothetical protein
MNEHQHTFLASLNRAASWRRLSTSDGGAAADLVVVALVAIDRANAPSLSRSTPGECH